jgi:hypothetical protein
MGSALPDILCDVIDCPRKFLTDLLSVTVTRLQVDDD